tara:strand:- start:806 stop:1213 length:408 start_codon:yes stop_codon:yes gene_type:complete
MKEEEYLEEQGFNTHPGSMVEICLVKSIMRQYAEAYHQAKLKEGEVNKLCDRCNGFTQIEQGGNIVDCYACKVTGEKAPSFCTNCGCPKPEKRGEDYWCRICHNEMSPIYSQEDINNSYDKGFKDGNQRDFNPSL